VPAPAVKDEPVTIAEPAPEVPADASDSNGEVPRRVLIRGMRTRVLVSFLVLLLVSTAASVLVLRTVLISRIDDQVTEALTRETDELSEISQEGRDPATGKPFNGDLRRIFNAYIGQTTAAEGAAVIAIVDDETYRIESGAGANSGLTQALAGLGQVREPSDGEIQTPTGPARYVAVPVTAGGQRGAMIVGQLLEPEREQVSDAVQIAIGVSIVVVLLASLFIWLAAGRAVAPLQALAGTARSISDSDLSQRIPVRSGDEIGQLGHTFNDMLDRLETSFADQKEFLADVSHELRTPITVIRGYLETLGDDPRERREAVAVIQDELDRMNRFVDDLMLLVRASRPDFLRPQRLDLDLLTHEIFAKARSLGDRRWSIDEAGVGIVEVDSQRITQAIMNLALNAVQHTRPGDGIAIGSALGGTQVRLWVRDEGPGIAPAEQQQIFQRFEGRAREAGSGGTGLGLAIVYAIAEAHGGKVGLESSLGDGATFSLVLPAKQGTAGPGG
jgi:signal transduction histidine kinase